MKLSQREKMELVKRYQCGISVASICEETGIARSTFYSWIKPYSQIKTNTGRVVTIQEYNALTQHVQKLEDMLAVLKLVDCCAISPTKEKLNAIEALHGQYSVRVLCEALEVPRGTYYNHIFRNKRDNTIYAKRRKELRIHIKDIYDENRQLFGAGKINAILRERGYHTCERTVSSLMKEMGISSVSTSSKHEYIKWQRGENKNVIQQNFHTDNPNQVWVSDVTAFKLNEKFYFICVIIDLFSRKIIAHRVSKKHSTQLITKTFRMAYAERQPPTGLIFHSDRGRQYTSFAFNKLLAEYNVTQSLSRSCKPHDNAVSESFFSYLKREELYRRHYRTAAEFIRGIEEYIDFHNTKRPHGALQYKTPDKMEEHALSKCL